MHSRKPRAGSSRISLLIKDCNIQAEVADNPASRSHGLMQRKSLDPDCGMLFVFPDEIHRSFWMKETYIPLSIAYLNEQGVILNIADMEPHNLKGVQSSGPAAYALEMNRGWFGQNGVYPGDQVSGLPANLAENKIRAYVRELLTEVPLDDFGYVTPTKKDEPVIVKSELADYFKDIPQSVNVYVAHTDDLNWAQSVPSGQSGKLPDHVHGRGITEISDVGGVAKLYPQLAQKMDGSAINLLYVYPKTYLTSDEFVPDVNPHYIAHDLHHIFELQNRNREVGGVGKDKFRQILNDYLNELLLAILGPHDAEYKAASKALGNIGRKFGVTDAEAKRFYSEIFPGYDFVSSDVDLLADAFAAYLKSGKEIQLGIPTSWKGTTGDYRREVDRDIQIPNNALTQAIANDYSKELQDLLDTLMEPLVGKVGIFNIFQPGSKDREKSLESAKGAGRKKYPELFAYFDSQGAKFELFSDYDEEGKALVVEFPHPAPGEDVWKVEDYAALKPDVVAKLGDLGFEIVEASTGFGFDKEGISLYLLPKKRGVSERLIRKYIRNILEESFLSHTYEPTVGDAVINTNPKCKHYQSAGVVVDINDLSGDSGKTIVYRTTNGGKNWVAGDVLEKTMDQLEAAS